MALLESTMVPLGSPCPDFTLPDIAGRIRSRDEFRAPLLLVVFMCNHCPYVQAVDDRINDLARTFAGRCDLIGINSNDASAYPEDSHEAMKHRAALKGYLFPYLRDEGQDVARTFGAVCTPDFFLYGPDRHLAYRGRLDDNWKDATAVQSADLREAMETLLAGQALLRPQHPSMGCSIKWAHV